MMMKMIVKCYLCVSYSKPPTRLTFILYTKALRKDKRKRNIKQMYFLIHNKLLRFRTKNTAWGRFTSSVKARKHLDQILNVVRADAALTFDWLFLLIVAAFVAAIGLVENSTVILVASMLISPLMVRSPSISFVSVVFLLLVFRISELDYR